jgi:uncharacterized membrane protein
MIAWLKTLWDAMWPNMFAPSAITLAAIGVSHARTRLHIKSNHQSVQAQVTQGLTDVGAKLDKQHEATHRKLAQQDELIATAVAAATAPESPAAERVIPPAKPRRGEWM